MPKFTSPKRLLRIRPHKNAHLQVITVQPLKWISTSNRSTANRSGVWWFVTVNLYVLQIYGDGWLIPACNVDSGCSLRPSLSSIAPGHFGSRRCMKTIWNVIVFFSLFFSSFICFSFQMFNLAEYCGRIVTLNSNKVLQICIPRHNEEITHLRKQT